MNEPGNGLFTRVTTISSLFTDFSSIPADVLAAAAERGTDVHLLCTALAKGLLVSRCPDVYQGYLDSFEAWFEFNVEEVLECENRRHCEKHMITGQMDFVARLKDRPGITLIDIKTSSRRYVSWDVQMGGYAYLLRESSPKIAIDNAVLVRLKEDGGKPIVNAVDDLDKAERVFFHALECYNYLKMKPKKIEVDDV
jgi:CRISPR/Cas system-associated exonuclease Cas4 (RecB family)